MKRAGNLFEQLISDENLNQALLDVNSGHHWRPHHRPNTVTAWVEETLPERQPELRKVIVDGFVQQPPKVTRRYDISAQKWRTVSEPKQWPDQYVHHALIALLKPIMMRGMDPYCCGSIERRGTHYGARAIARWMKKDPKGTKYCMTLDIRHFYQSLKPEVVMDRMRQLIKDGRVLDLIERTIKGGVLIGAYTSQWYANTTLQPLDHMIREGGWGVSHYLRYIDNFTIFCPNKRKLRKLKQAIEAWLHSHSMRLKGDWQIFETDRTTGPPSEKKRHRKGRMPSALGYRYGRGFTIPRKRNFLRLKRCVARFRWRRVRGRRILAGSAAGLISRFGQLRHCNSVQLYKRVLRGEKLLRHLKNIIRSKQKEEKITWSMYMARRARWRSSRPRETPTPT